jgi:hypothetical protein
MGKAIRDALAAIDQVHGAIGLVAIPFVETEDTDRHGFFEKTAKGKPIRIGISSGVATPVLTTVHEIGHWLDTSALHVPFEHRIDEIDDADLRLAYREFWSAIRATNSVRSLSQTMREARDTNPNRASFIGNYLLLREELWARAYSQYVATQSSVEALHTELVKEQGLSGYPVQWTDEDFAPVRKSIDKIFVAMGWITNDDSINEEGA